MKSQDFLKMVNDNDNYFTSSLLVPSIKAQVLFTLLWTL